MVSRDCNVTIEENRLMTASIAWPLTLHCACACRTTLVAEFTSSILLSVRLAISNRSRKNFGSSVVRNPSCLFLAVSSCLRSVMGLAEKIADRLGVDN